MFSGVYTSAFSIGVAAIEIIFVLLIIYLFTVRGKSPATKWFMGFFGGVSCVFTAFLILYSTVDQSVGKGAWRLLHMFVFGSVSIVQFAYHFPKNDHPRESRIVLVVTSVTSVFALVQYFHSTETVPAIFVFEAFSYNYFGLVVPGIIIGLQLGWMLVVFLRKSAAYSTYEYRGRFAVPAEDENAGTIARGFARFMRGFSKMIHADTRYAKAHRSLALVFFWPSVLVVFILLAYLGVITWQVLAYMFSVGILAVFAYLYLIYVNNANEPTSFMLKLVGISLVILLVVLGTVGNIAVAAVETGYDRTRLLEADLIRRDLQTAREMDPPADVVYVVSRSGADGLYEGNYRFHYSRPGFDRTLPARSDRYRRNALLAALPPEAREREARRLDALVVEQGIQKETRMYRKAEDANPATFFVTYAFLHRGRIVEVGFEYLAYRRIVHESTFNIIIVLLLSTLLALILLPLFFRLSLVRPLENLLGGVRDVNAGKLDVHVPVQVDDEIGFLSRSFNTMVSSIREARGKLSEYAETLEDRVKFRTAELTEAREETDEIMRQVREGLCLVFTDGKAFPIGNQYSKVLEEILQTRDLARRDLAQVLAPLMSADDLEDVYKYLRLMFNHSMDEEQLNELSPLEQVELRFGEKTKHLRFTFRRIIRDEIIIRLMVTVKDVTEQVRLEDELRETQQRQRGEMERLFKLLHVEPELLKDFIDGSLAELAAVDAVLKDEENRDFKDKVTSIYRSVHTIKGNAALLDLDFISEMAHEFEEDMERLRDLPELKGEDFLSVPILYHRLNATLVEVDELTGKLLRFQDGFGREERGDMGSLLLEALRNTVAKLGAELGKQARLESGDFNFRDMPSRHRITVKDVLVQLVRNSMSHGIEPPDERVRLGKDGTGRITLSSNRENGSFVFRLRDDGGGIRLDRIKDRALESGVTQEQLRAMDEGALVELIFRSGMSTSARTSPISGRGVGMDLVRGKISNIGGRITVQFAEGSYTEFTISIPG